LLTHCGERTNPLSSADSGALGVRLLFHGRNITKLEDLTKINTNIAKSQAIDKIVIRVLASESGDTLSTTEVDIGPGDESFEVNIGVPVGEARVVEVDAFETIIESADDPDDPTIGQNVLAWRGRETGINVQENDPILVDITLVPLPILGRRVVLYVGEGSGAIGSQSNPVDISIANLDNIRGIQFDLEFDESILFPEAVRRKAVIDGFSDVIGERLDSNTYRIIIFDQDSSFPAEISPVSDFLTKVQMVEVLFGIVEEASSGQSGKISLKKAVATDSNLNIFEVFSVDGNFMIR